MPNFPHLRQLFFCVRLSDISRRKRYPGKLELRAPKGATPITLRMQAQTAARFEDVLAHVTFTGAGSKGGQPSGPLMGPDQSMGPGGLATPPKRAGACLRAPPQQTDRC